MGHAGAAGVRRRLGRDELSLDLCLGWLGKHTGSKWRNPTSSWPGWESGTRAMTREQRLAFIPPVLSPAAPHCLSALDCSCIFSASAVYWVTLMQKCTQRASHHPVRPFLCHQHHEPQSSPWSTVMPLNWAGRAPKAALLWGQCGLGASGTPQASSSAHAGAMGF